MKNAIAIVIAGAMIAAAIWHGPQNEPGRYQISSGSAGIVRLDIMTGEVCSESLFPMPASAHQPGVMALGCNDTRKP